MKAFFRENGFALLILLLAAVFRFANAGNFDFVHDELSALSRTGYLSFTELLQKGIYTDTHPPLVQVWMNYWVLLFGTGEFAVKLPFILAGLAGIWLIWLLGKFWFGKIAALSTMAFLACSEYVIAYHQQARPYAAGFFFCILAVWAFTGYFMKEPGSKKSRLLLYILACAAAALTHHLALLFILLFAAGSLFFIQKTQLKAWIIAHASIALLYLPNLNLVLKQFSQRGVGEWLGPPDWHSFQYIAGWFTHYSTLCALTISCLAVVGLLSGWFHPEKRKVKLLLLFLSAACTLIPFFYSIYVNPIFQFSSLFFVFPFFLLLLFSGLPQIRKAWIIPSLVLLAVGGSFLIQRNYYSISAHQPVAEMCRQSISRVKNHPEEKSLAILNAEAWFIQFYQRKYGQSFPFETWYEKPFKGNDLVRLMEERKPNVLMLGWMPELAIPLAQEKYTCMLQHHRSPQLDFYVFAKPGFDSCIAEKPLFESRLFESNPVGRFWENRSDRIIQDEKGNVLVFSEGDEFGCAFEASLDEMAINRHSILECKAQFVGALPEDVLLTAVITREGSQVPSLYIGEEANLQYSGQGFDGQVYLRTRIVDKFRENEQMRGCKLKVYVWNRGRKPLKVRDIQVKWLEGNPELYGLYEE